MWFFMPQIDGWVSSLLGLTAILLSLAVSIHPILYKRDARAALAWVGVIWLVPIAGPVLYAVFGVNRVRRKASRLRGFDHLSVVETAGDHPFLDHVESQFRPLVRLVDRVVHHPAVPGNRISLLQNGDEAYPAMLQSIEEAQKTVSLASYIFNNDAVGKVFCEKLADARSRGVSIRVLVDDVGRRYSRKPIHRLLERLGIPWAYFLRTLVPWRIPYLNLRNHRKLLVIDGRIGFTGGMNIQEGNLTRGGKLRIRDVHARLEGPVVTHLQEAFVEDWEFAVGERLEGEDWFPKVNLAGTLLARGIPAGPDEDFEVLRMTLLGALPVADRRVSILTPYFVPDAALITALGVTAMRGVEVDIVLPGRSNLAFVHWATMATLWQVLERGCRVWLSPPPFDHSKLVVIDEAWTLLGSANWDARTLRLNFEFNVECYDCALARSAQSLIDERKEAARPITLDEVDGRSFPVRLRDGVARLFSPYL